MFFWSSSCIASTYKPIAAGVTAPPLTPQGKANITPGIIKYAFWRRTAANPNAVYCCLNLGEASVPEEIAPRSICIDRDIREVLCALAEKV